MFKNIQFSNINKLLFSMSTNKYVNLHMKQYFFKFFKLKTFSLLRVTRYTWKHIFQSQARFEKIGTN